MATISRDELRDPFDEALRRAAAGEHLTITVSGRPVARLSPVRDRRRVSSALLCKLWATPPDPTLDDDLRAIAGAPAKL